MKKVIKPSKQPTKKQSQRRQRNTNTAKLKKAIGKIAAQLVKNHPKLVKGGGSSGITDLIFSKNLMKGGEINDELRGDIVNFLKVSAPKVNKLKKDLLIKIIDDFINNEKAVNDDRASIINLHKEFNKDVYEYEYEDNYKELFKDKKDIYDDFIILDIVKKFYILSRIEKSIQGEINNSQFQKLSDDLTAALNSYNHSVAEKKDEVKTNIKGLLEKYKNSEGEDVKEVGVVEGNTPEKIDKATKYAELVANAEDVYKNNRDVAEKLSGLFKLRLVNDVIYTELDEPELDEEKKKDLKDFNTLYTELKDKESKIREMMGTFNENTPADDKIAEVQKLIDEFNDSYKNINRFYKIFDITINVPYLKDNDDTRREASTDLVVFQPKTGGSGGNPTKYKSTGQVVNIMYKKRKYKRTIFVKEKRKTKYCKINNEYILLSKLNVL